MSCISSLRASSLLLLILVPAMAFSATYDPETLTVPAASLLPQEMLQGAHYRIADDVLVSGYMNHYTVDSDFGQFTAVGNLKLKKLLHEIEAIAELKGMTSAGVGADAAVGVVTDVGKSTMALVTDPVGTVNNLGAGVSRMFKRTSKTAKDVSQEVGETVTESPNDEDTGSEAGNADAEPSVSSQVASSYLGIGKAQRQIAQELEVDPYSDNAVLQAELARVAKVSGTVGRITKIVIPIPSLVGTATSVSNMVWSLSPTDLLIQNQETLEAMGFDEDLIERFFSNERYSPSEQTVLVASIKALDTVKGREILLQNAAGVESGIEGEFMVRSILFIQIYHEQIEPLTEIVASPTAFVPVSITKSNDGIVFAPLDQLLWTEAVANAVAGLAKLMDENDGTDEHLLWVEGQISELALTHLESVGWVETSAAFRKLGQMTEE